jgi:hypothetical protein
VRERYYYVEAFPMVHRMAAPPRERQEGAADFKAAGRPWVKTFRDQLHLRRSRLRRAA